MNELCCKVKYSQETSGYSTEINEGVLTNYSGGIGKPANCSCKPVGSGRIQTTTATFDQRKNQEQRSTPLHLNKSEKTQMSPSFTDIQASLSRGLFPFSKYLRRRDRSRGSLKGRGGWTGPVMSDLPCPSSGEQERTCNCPWSRLAHVAQGYWRTVNSARDIFMFFRAFCCTKQIKHMARIDRSRPKSM